MRQKSGYLAICSLELELEVSITGTVDVEVRGSSSCGHERAEKGLDRRCSGRVGLVDSWQFLACRSLGGKLFDLLDCVVAEGRLALEAVVCRAV